MMKEDLPPPIDLPEPAPVVVLQPAGRGSQVKALQEINAMLESRRTSLRPASVSEDVWSLVEDLRNNGSLFDLSVELARLEREQLRIDALLEDNEILKSEAVRLKVQIAKVSAEVKEKAVVTTLKMRDVITMDMLGNLMDSVYAVLRRHISDPHQLQGIGVDLALALRATLAAMKRDA